MKLSEKQALFTLDIAKLILKAEELGIKLTFGEAYRPQFVQKIYYYAKEIDVSSNSVCVKDGKKRSWTLHSNHARRLAVDFNFFVNGFLTYDYKTIEPLGRYWESLRDVNRWGGFFMTRDIPHFEANYKS